MFRFVTPRACGGCAEPYAAPRYHSLSRSLRSCNVRAARRRPARGNASHAGFGRPSTTRPRAARARFPRPRASWELPPRRRRRADAQGTTRGCMRSQNRVHGLSRAKRPSAQWCVSPGWEFGPDRGRRLDTGGAAQSATPHGRLKFSPRSRPNYLRKVTSEGRCSMGARASSPRTRSPTGDALRTGTSAPGKPVVPPLSVVRNRVDNCRPAAHRGLEARAPGKPAVPGTRHSQPERHTQSGTSKRWVARAPRKAGAAAGRSLSRSPDRDWKPGRACG